MQSILFCIKKPKASLTVWGQCSDVNGQEMRICVHFLISLAKSNFTNFTNLAKSLKI